MNAAQPSHPTHRLEAVQARLRQLKQSLARQQARSERRHKTLLVSGIVLNILCVVALGGLTNMAFQLDAEALTQIGRLQFEKALPDGRASLAGYLKAEAPQIVRHTLTSLLDSMPRLRQMLVRDLQSRLRMISEVAEGRFVQMMEETIRSSRADVDRQFPHLGEREKLEKLVSLVADRFHQNLEICLDQLYPDYVREMTALNNFLQGLSGTEDSKLTRRERTQKAIIQTLLKLMARQKSGLELLPAAQS
ncbi:MAG: hypothetical protein JXA90_03430 [Planctomycetes bacterium]|nr:hypothetical protein [Planctomycetota bacterium]